MRKKKKKHFRERGQGVGRPISSLVALQAGCQRNAGSIANPLKHTTRRRKVKSAKFVAKIVFFFFFFLSNSLFCSPVIVHNTKLKLKQQTLWSATTPFFKKICDQRDINFPPQSSSTLLFLSDIYSHCTVSNWSRGSWCYIRATSSHEVLSCCGLNAKSSQPRSKKRSKDCGGKSTEEKTNINTLSITSLDQRRLCSCIQTGIFLD